MIIIRRLLFVLAFLFCVINASAVSLWVGQTYTWDFSGSVLGSVYNMSVSPNGGYLSITGSGFYRNITPTQYFSGSATVTAEWDYTLYYGDTKRHQKVTLTITCNENKVSISPTSVTLSPGQRYQLGYRHAYDNAYVGAANVYFSGGNSSFSVSTSGEIIAKSPGTGYVTVYSKLSSAANAPSCFVTVKEIEPTSATTSNISLLADQSKDLTVTVSPSNASIRSKQWYVKDGNDVVSLSGTRITGLKAGKATVYCMVNGSIRSNNATVTVTEPMLTVNSFSPQNEATEVSVFVQPSVTYSHAVSEGKTFQSIKLTGAGTTVQGDVAISGNSVRFMPTKPLSPNTKYRLTVPATAVQNKWGKVALNEAVLDFITGSLEQATITMTPVSGTFLSRGEVVVLTSEPSDAIIYYTVDGTEPTKTSTVYTAPIEATEDFTLKAFASREGYADSEVATGEFRISQSEIVDYYPSDEKPLFNYGPAVPHLKLSGEVVKSNNFRRISLIDSHGVDVDGEAYLTKYMISFVPDEPLANGEEYTLTIPYDAVKTANGEVFKGYSWTFKTPVMPVKVAMQGDETVLVHSENGTLRSRGKEYLSTTPADGSFTSKDISELTVVQNNVIDFSAGYTYRSVADGSTAKGYGLAYCGETAWFPKPANVKIMKAGFQTTAVIDKNNTLWMCGRNDFGQLADSTGTTSKSFVKSADNIIDVAPGNGYTLYVDTDNVLWGVGRNHLGQLGDGTTVDRVVPVKILEGVAKVFASTSGWFSACLTTDNQLLTWGDNSSSQLGREAGTYSAAPSAVALADVEKVSLGGAHALAVTSDGRLFSWGSNVSGQIAESGSVLKTPTLVAEGVKMAAAGPNTSLVMSYSGKILGYGRKTHSNFGSGEGKVYGFVVDPGIACHPLHGVKIEPYKFEVAPGEEFAFVARPEPYSADYESVEWVSDHPEIAEVAGNGVIRAGNLGEATVTVRLTDRHGAVKEAKAKVVSTDTPDNSDISKVSTLHASEWSAFSDGDLIIIKNAAAGCVYTVYNVQGITVGQAMADGDELIFEVGQPGVYIVSSGMKTVKILCR